MKKFAVGALAALGLAAAVPAVAQAPQVTLAISRVGGGPQGTTTAVKYGELVRLSGELANGQPNQSVQLTVTPYRGDTRTVTLTTDSTGAFRWSHRPTIRTGYTARWSNQASAQEPYAHVLPKVGLRVLNAQLGRFRVTIMAQPEHVSRVVYFQRRVRNNRWATVRRVRLRTSNLSARFSARLPRGTQRVRILVPATPGYLRATSAFVRVTH
ncbi:MAG TPA: hypothetical protein VFL41_09105 [Gaiellaceae bacterium]|nr:hypothetical protein [Gaiellaceae bacterium]HET8653149.1 hypothetical protein [Gaiellaceae bacterium]